jgi:hypothetical protein
MANVKVFADRQTDRQTNRRTDGQAKNYMPPIYRYGGIKMVKKQDVLNVAILKWVISNHKPWEILSITYLPPYTCFPFIVGIIKSHNFTPLHFVHKLRTIGICL